MSFEPLKHSLSRSQPEPAAVDRVWAQLKRRSARRFPARRAIAAAAVVVAMGSAGLWTAMSARSTSESTLALPGGSTVTFSPDAEVTFEQGPSGLAVHVARGSARFAIAAPCQVSTSRFMIRVAAAEVEVMASETMDSVRVTRGRAELSGQGVGPLALGAGQHFASSVRAQARWESLAREGRFAEAWAVLGGDGVRREVGAAPAEVQLLLADVAAAGHDEALARSVLRAVVQSPAASSQRALAAYTLGLRLSASEPREAASAFEESLRLELAAELREEACRRAGSAWTMAGEPAHPVGCSGPR